MASVKVADGQTALAAQYNSLVDDVFDTTVGHNHNGADGGRLLSHGHLIDGAIGDTANSHAAIDAHIAAAQGQHGLPAAAFATGMITNNWVMEAGVASINPASVGTVECWGTVTTNLTAIGAVIVTPVVDLNAYGGSGVRWFVTQVSGNQFDVHFTSSSGSFNAEATAISWYWLALGTKS
jgi:hypothetical protein